jgi:hypothetical protein
MRMLSQPDTKTARLKSFSFLLEFAALRKEEEEAAFSS